MATANSPFQDLSQEHRQQLLTIYGHYMSVLDALSKEELANFDWEACHAQMVEELIGMAGLIMNDGTIIAQCTRLSEKLHAHVNDRLTLTTATVKGRLTTVLHTPLNAIKQRLSLSSTRASHKTIQRVTSANSLDELLNDSPSHNNTTIFHRKIPSSRSCWKMKSLNQKLTAHLLTNPSLIALFVDQSRGPETVNLPRDSQLNLRRKVALDHAEAHEEVESLHSRNSNHANQI